MLYTYHIIYTLTDREDFTTMTKFRYFKDCEQITLYTYHIRLRHTNREDFTTMTQLRHFKDCEQIMQPADICS